MRTTIQRRARQWLPTLLAVMCLGATGIANAQAPSSDNSGIRDAWLDGKLESALLFNPHLNSFDIHTDVRGGVAYLSGFVESDIDRDLAVAIAESIEGVTSVESTMEIDPRQAMAAAKSEEATYKERRTLKQTVSDLTLGARVKAKLLTNDNTTGTTIGVDAMQGVVTLRGVVKSAEEKALAGQLSANVPGATEVKNELNINSGS